MFTVPNSQPSLGSLTKITGHNDSELKGNTSKYDKASTRVAKWRKVCERFDNKIGQEGQRIGRMCTGKQCKVVIMRFSN